MSSYKKRWRVKQTTPTSSMVQDLGLSDIRETVAKARAEGDNKAIAGNVKPWLLKHIMQDINSGGPQKKPAATEVTITENR